VEGGGLQYLVVDRLYSAGLAASLNPLSAYKSGDGAADVAGRPTGIDLKEEEEEKQMDLRKVTGNE